MVEFGNTGNKQKLPGRKSKTKDWGKERPEFPQQHQKLDNNGMKTLNLLVKVIYPIQNSLPSQFGNKM